MIRGTEARDLERALDMADAKRRAVAVYHPIFHRPAVDARAVQAPWFRTMIERSSIVTLVHEDQDGIDGFIAANPFPGTPLTFRVDDFVVARAELWSSVGRSLLHVACREVTRRGAESWEVNCQPRDEAKRRMLVSEGLVAARLNVVNHDPLPDILARLGPASVPVRHAVWEEIDRAGDLIMDQLKTYHELDPRYYRPPDWKAERERLRGVMNEPGSVCIAVGEAGGYGDYSWPTSSHASPCMILAARFTSCRASLRPEDRGTRTGMRCCSAMRLIAEQGAALMNTFAQRGDAERTSALAEVGLTVVTEFFRQDLSR